MNDLAAGAKNAGRTSHEGRGLKYPNCMCHLRPVMGRTSHEVRGLKFKIIRTPRSLMQSRTSHEVRGLKLRIAFVKCIPRKVAPHTRCVD